MAEATIREYTHDPKMVFIFESEVAFAVICGFGIAVPINPLLMMVLPPLFYHIAVKLVREKPRGYITHMAIALGLNKLAHYPLVTMNRGNE